METPPFSLPSSSPLPSSRLGLGGVVVGLVMAASGFLAAMAEPGGGLFSPSTARLCATDSARPAVAELAAFDVVVLEAGAEAPKPRAGQIFLARVRPSLATDTKLVEKAAKAGVPVLRSAKGTEPPKLDIGHASWAALAVKEVVEPVLGKGFAGVVIEGVGGLAGEEQALAKGIHQAHPEAWVFVREARSLDAPESQRLGYYIEGEAAELGKAGPAIAQARKAGLPVLAVGYGKANDAAGCQALAKSLSDQGALPFITSAKARGVALAPLQERSRRVLVLHSWSVKEAEKAAKLPIDTMTADLFQTPLEWLGYEADFFDVGAGAALPEPSAGRYAAVLLDAELEFPTADEMAAVEWLVALKAARVPILFTGGIPFSRDDALDILRDALELRGTLAPATRVTAAEVVMVDKEMMASEAKMSPRATDFKDLQAPTGARMLVALAGKDAILGQVSYTPAFLASWGGMWLEPSIILRGSQDSYLFYADPYKLLSALLKPNGPLPSPDTTTREGRRLFYSHIDGDGFGSQSSFKGHPFCAELVRDRILKTFPFPVTVSVVEADIRAQAKGLDDAWAPRFVDIARSIFALPNVEAASHSYAHPYQWFEGDPDPGVYDEPFMTLKPEVPYTKVDLQREVAGSVDFINKTLLPADKRVGLFLWSGNCRPGHDALRMVRELGIENMNGGNTIVSRLYPGIAGIAPRVVQWGDELQINAANQNEFMYANGWSGPFYGGFADVIDTFERTELPRRLKPVNVYYHFYSATSLSSLRALEKIHHWCQQQPLHPVTAVQFARMTRDAHRTRIFDLGPRHWLLTNSGDLRTYRLPTELGRPDMARCRGVTGYVEASGSLYIHTDGSPRVELALSDAQAEPPSRSSAFLYLATSTGETDFATLDGWRADFQVKGQRPVETEFRGLPAKAACDVTIDTKTSTLSADDKGHLRLSLPAQAHVVIDANRSRYAVLQ